MILGAKKNPFYFSMAANIHVIRIGFKKSRLSLSFVFNSISLKLFCFVFVSRNFAPVANCWSKLSEKASPWPVVPNTAFVRVAQSCWGCVKNGRTTITDLKHFSNLIDRGSVDRISLDIFTWSNFSIKRLKISQLIEKFDQLPKNNLQILAVDRKF